MRLCQYTFVGDYLFKVLKPCLCAQNHILKAACKIQCQHHPLSNTILAVHSKLNAIYLLPNQNHVSQYVRSVCIHSFLGDGSFHFGNAVYNSFDLHTIEQPSHLIQNTAVFSTPLLRLYLWTQIQVFITTKAINHVSQACHCVCQQQPLQGQADNVFTGNTGTV